MAPAPVFDRPIAHRGLHDRAAGVIENSASAFAAAIAEGYAIECDLQLTSDGVPVVFHDDNLKRLTGRDGRVSDLTIAELTSLPLLDSKAGDCPQRFTDMLRQVAGRAMLQVELKRQPPGPTGPTLARLAVEAVAGYGGPLVFESFDPLLIMHCRRFGFRGPRGIISYDYRRHDGDGNLSNAQRFALRHLLHYPWSRFDFISCEQDSIDLGSVKFFRALGKPVTAWTIRSPQSAVKVADGADQIVFEGFRRIVPEQSLIATIHESTASIPPAVWNGLLPSTDGRPDNPFLDHAFFLALEASGSATRRTGWDPRHILLSDQGGAPIGMVPMFLKAHSQGEYVFDHGWAQAYEHAGGNYYPKLLSAVPFTPVTAPKLLVPTGDRTIKRALLTAVESLGTQLGVSSAHATFVPEEESGIAIATGWLVRHDTQFHWHNQGFSSFEDFLGTMSSRHRKVARRERRDALADGLTVKWLTGSALTEAAWDAFFKFYTDTGSRKWGRPYLNRRFFSLLSAAMADRIVLMIVYDGAEAVAGTLNLLGGDTLYGRYWGATREVPFLHFELCYYQSIEFAIAHGLKKVEAGAQGDHKLARGYVPSTTRSVHWIGHAGLRRAVADFVEHERASVSHEQAVLTKYTPFRKGEPQDNS